jgi:hypothetical protein
MRWRQGTPGDDGLGHQGATIWPSTPRAATLGDTIGWWLGTPLRAHLGARGELTQGGRPPEDLFGKLRIQVDGRGLKGILGNFDL